MTEKNISLTKEDLQEILATVIEAAKAPNPVEAAELERQKKEMLDKNNERLQNSAEIKKEMENKRLIRTICTHEHANGDTHAVYVQEQVGPGYFICQKNQCKIRPEPKPEKNYDRDAIYSTQEFNRLFQKAHSNEMFA